MNDREPSVTWADLFSRAADGAVTVDDVREAQAARRSPDQHDEAEHDD